MIATILIVGISVALFVYWFRYTCVLILSVRSTEDFAGEVASANQLNFLNVQESLRSGATNLAAVHALLDRDYALLTYMLNHTAQLEVGGASLEEQILRLDYRIMKAWFTLAKLIWPDQARFALEEMSQVVAHLANQMGERTAIAAGN
jgi:hypothetical protein